MDCDVMRPYQNPEDIEKVTDFVVNITCRFWHNKKFESSWRHEFICSKPKLETSLFKWHLVGIMRSTHTHWNLNIYVNKKP